MSSSGLFTLLFLQNLILDAFLVELVKVNAITDNAFGFSWTALQLCDAQEHTVVIDVIVLEELCVCCELLCQDLALLRPDIDEPLIREPVAIFKGNC